MYKILYPKRDATIYEKAQYRNTGADQIIEITKFAEGQTRDDESDLYAEWGSTYNSRILLDFDLSGVTSQTIDTGSAQYYLNLYSIDSVAVANEYTLYAHPIAESWVNGNGYYNDRPEVTNGVSWAYKSSKDTADQWNSASYVVEYTSVSGGGSWNSNYVASQSFSFQSPDIRMNVTPIVQEWVSGSITNNGFILKHSSGSEGDSNVYGSLKFFGKDTHTIYIPRLEIFWDNHSGYTGSFSTASFVDNNYTVYCKNLKSFYRVGENIKLRLGVREKYPTKSYSRSVRNITPLRFPETTYYSVVDYVTGTSIVPYNTVGTKIDLDDDGHFITLDLANFLPVRYYKVLIKVVDDNGTEIIDSGINFKVER